MKILLLLSFLSLWTSDETGAEPITVVNEGEDVVLPCSSHESIGQKIFHWKKDKGGVKMEVFLYSKGDIYGERRVGQDEAFKGRVSHFPEQLDDGNASIVIRASRVSDSGTYTCIIPEPKPQRESNVVLVVRSAPKPYIATLGETIEGVQLQCEVLGASPKPVVQLIQNSTGDVVPAEEPQVSDRGDKYEVILRATVTKTGYYRCVATQEEIHHQIYSEEYIIVPGAATEPNIKILGETKDGVRLQCSVRGASPKPEVYWQDGDKNLTAEEPQVSDRGGSYDIILHTTVSKSGRYRCVATQEEIHHQIYTEEYIIVPDGVPVWAVVGAVCLALVVGVVVGVVVHKMKTKSKPADQVGTETTERDALKS